MREVVIKFLLDEEVSPDLFAERVFEACTSQHALRPGERVEVVATGTTFSARDTEDRQKERAKELHAKGSTMEQIAHALNITRIDAFILVHDIHDLHAPPTTKNKE